MVEIGVPEDRNTERNAQDIRDVPISNIPIGSHFETAPPFMLPQQHMDVSEFRELVYKLSDNQASMMEYLQSLIEPHPDKDLDSSYPEFKSILKYHF